MVLSSASLDGASPPMAALFQSEDINLSRLAPNGEVGMPLEPGRRTILAILLLTTSIFSICPDSSKWFRNSTKVISLPFLPVSSPSLTYLRAAIIMSNSAIIAGMFCGSFSSGGGMLPRLLFFCFSSSSLALKVAFLVSVLVFFSGFFLGDGPLPFLGKKFSNPLGILEKKVSIKEFNSETRFWDDGSDKFAEFKLGFCDF
mmetsp:Transcript_33122/g.80020  ORF Transcript_33122/g.80020 Transcript_33122/m.80020 type:complete len:201 (+) Transcript_33122:2883-3485(+)